MRGLKTMTEQQLLQYARDEISRRREKERKLVAEDVAGLGSYPVSEAYINTYTDMINEINGRLESFYKSCREGK